MPIRRSQLLKQSPSRQAHSPAANASWRWKTCNIWNHINHLPWGFARCHLNRFQHRMMHIKIILPTSSFALVEITLEKTLCCWCCCSYCCCCFRCLLPSFQFNVVCFVKIHRRLWGVVLEGSSFHHTHRGTGSYIGGIKGSFLFFFLQLESSKTRHRSFPSVDEVIHLSVCAAKLESVAEKPLQPRPERIVCHLSCV